MALIPKPTLEQKAALDIVRGYFNLAASGAETRLLGLNAFGTRGLVAAEFAHGFRRSCEMCEMVLELFPSEPLSPRAEQPER